VLCHDAFEIVLAGDAVKPFAVVFEMVAIEQSLTTLLSHSTEIENREPRDPSFGRRLVSQMLKSPTPKACSIPFSRR
jgi:hypothetical protein